ncbi:hypothetical protein QUF76_17170, partial [Desulfobacterales bacterium HSG16]|nr:hypothetical protein [Desulfobacterales bacterium HSG16]
EKGKKYNEYKKGNAMKRNFILFLLCMIFIIGSFSSGMSSEIVKLATLEWEPYIGSEIPDKLLKLLAIISSGWSEDM